MVIVESDLQFNKFVEKYKKSRCILTPIFSDFKKHCLQNRLSIMYVKLLTDNSEYILPFNHSEALNISIDNIKKLNCDNVKYTFNKKELNHIIKLDNVVDINLLNYMKYNIPLNTEEITSNSHQYFSNTLYHRENINDVIPILKHLEYCRKLNNKFEPLLNNEINYNYNDDVIDSLSFIESSGLETIEGKMYSEYNIFTSTGRPSNRFGGTNFAALNKSDGSREKFISRFNGDGMLVEFDYDGYHLRIVADMIGFDLPEGSVHEYFAKEYNVDYKESKSLSFKYLYGGIPKEIEKNIPFFKKTNEYIDSLWNIYKRDNFIKSDIYNKKLLKQNLTDMNKNKLFNYLIQLMETEYNMKMLTNLIPFIKAYNSKLILYSYDSVLIDFKLEDGKIFLDEIRNIIENNGQFPTKMSRGVNYHKMELVG